jgi:methyl-accepting chemotaxis protein
MGANMEKADKNKRFKSKLGLRLIITIGIVVLVTMVFFEYLAYVNVIKIPTQHFGEFFFLHSVHTAVTLLVILAVIYYIIARYVLKPIRKLLYALEEMEKGKFVTSLEIKSGDEFEFLADRFNNMGFKLREYVQRFIRIEKYSSAIAISRRITNEIKMPCSSLRANIKLLHSLTKENPQLSKLVGQVHNDLRSIENKLNELERIEMPEELINIVEKEYKR